MEAVSGAGDEFIHRIYQRCISGGFDLDREVKNLINNGRLKSLYNTSLILRKAASNLNIRVIFMTTQEILSEIDQYRHNYEDEFPQVFLSERPDFRINTQIEAFLQQHVECQEPVEKQEIERLTRRFLRQAINDEKCVKLILQQAIKILFYDL
jgi:hypothetical protein